MTRPRQGWPTRRSDDAALLDCSEPERRACANPALPPLRLDREPQAAKSSCPFLRRHRRLVRELPEQATRPPPRDNSGATCRTRRRTARKSTLGSSRSPKEPYVLASKPAASSRVSRSHNSAENHHDAEIVDEAGRVLVRRRPPAHAAGSRPIRLPSGAVVRWPLSHPVYTHRIDRVEASVRHPRHSVSRAQRATTQPRTVTRYRLDHALGSQVSGPKTS